MQAQSLKPHPPSSASVLKLSSFWLHNDCTNGGLLATEVENLHALLDVYVQFCVFAFLCTSVRSLGRSQFRKLV